MKVLNAKKIGTARSAGFTIVELVVVILLLGILAATALPRFIDVTEDAYDAAVDGVFGGFATGVGLFRAQWVANGQQNSAAVTGFGAGTAFAGTSTTGRGYPVGTNASFADNGDCGQVWTDVLQGGRPALVNVNAANGSTAAREALVEGATLNGADYVAMGNTAEASKTGCLYYYVGRFQSGDSTTPRTIPFISYNASSGEISLNEVAFDND